MTATHVYAGSSIELVKKIMFPVIHKSSSMERTKHSEGLSSLGDTSTEVYFLVCPLASVVSCMDTSGLRHYVNSRAGTL
jgi:hypothetical protein